jgi:putative ABC transport system permease protein
MRERKITPFGLAVMNLKHRPFRTFCLAAFVSILSFFVCGGSILAYSLLNGASSMAERLGADALFVPLGYEKSAEGALLRGEPSSFYFSGELSERLMRADGVNRASPQLFIASFNSAHCAFPAQLIGYDPKTDFTIAPWLSKKIPGGPGDGEVVVGSSVNRKAGDDITFFGRSYKVAGRLDKTGIGFDTSIFLNMDTARVALSDYASYAEDGGPDDAGAVSSITVDIKKGVEHAKFAREIRETFRGDLVGVVVTQRMLDDISRDLGAFLVIIAVMLAVLWVLAVLVLAIMFTVALNERKREFGIYRALGATRIKLCLIVLCESCAVSLLGSALGVISLVFFVFPFAPLIAHSLGTAYLQPPAKILFLILAGGLSAAFLTGPIASLNSAVAIGRRSAYEAIKEGE